ncbi:MAG: hypothetical protein CL678_04970 [Bdellovibrionaceae bacterium]|nr:hypothetical protein [Pseudobdellovibrionaceae bacterium]
MIEIELDKIPPAEKYKLLIGAIVPRPIAFVSTRGKNGISNLAPFSFYTGVSTAPPCVLFSIVNHPKKGLKDTMRNIQETGEFVVNSVNQWIAEAAHYSSEDLDYEINEFERVGLTEIESTVIQAPRVKEAAVQMECKTHQIVNIGGNGPGATNLVIGEILKMHIDERIYSDGKIDFNLYQPVGRIGGPGYVHDPQITNMPPAR